MLLGLSRDNGKENGNYYTTLRVQVPNNHILPQNLYHNPYHPNPKYLIIGYMDPVGYNHCCDVMSFPGGSAHSFTKAVTGAGSAEDPSEVPTEATGPQGHRVGHPKSLNGLGFRV